MGDPARPLSEFETGTEKQKFEDTLKFLEKIKTPELIIGLCGPIGSPLNEVSSCLEEILVSLKYTVYNIKLSDFIKAHFSTLIKDPKYKKDDDYLTNAPNKFELKMRLIEIGNLLRDKYNSTFLAECAIKEIFPRRSADTNTGGIKDNNMDSPQGTNLLSESTKGKRIAFIINSIKNQSEYDLLKQVYREIFYMVGATSSKDCRVENLCEQNDMTKGQVWELIDEETGEEIKHGQTVKDTFPLADYFINVHPKNNDEIKLKIVRFIKLIFGGDVESKHVYIPTPTIHETGMYTAAAAAWNSACLSRQVGAALTDDRGEILSVGWNDVPVYGGGLYHHNKEKIGKSTGLFYNPQYKDERCFKHLICYNDRQKDVMSKRIVEALKKEGLLNVTVDDFEQKSEKAIRSTKISSLVEFSRSIHAEMHAIISGCISAGDRVRNGKLYITTYPCHICARHIIMAGIKEIYYIEPYKKSLTTTLHSDSITDNEDLKVNELHKVHIKQFEGVGPTRYMQLFKMAANSRKEKSTGNLLENQSDKDKFVPKYSLYLAALPSVEGEIIKTLNGKLS